MSRRYTEAQRKSLFEEQARTGEALRAIARRLGIHEAVAYKWAQEQKQANEKPSAPAGVSFARVVRETPMAWLVVEVGRARIRVPPEFDEQHLERVVRTLTREDVS